MRFELYSTVWYDTKDIIERYPCLKDFKVEECTVKKDRYITTLDENGNRIRQVIKDDRTETKCFIDIDTIDQLINLLKAADNELVIGKDFIEIYDGYRE